MLLTTVVQYLQNIASMETLMQALIRTLDEDPEQMWDVLIIPFQKQRHIFIW